MNCHFCGGALEAVTGPGRWREYRGVRCEIPADFAINTCVDCKRSWISDDRVAELSAALERQPTRT